MDKKIFAAEVSHENAPVAVREWLAVKDFDKAHLLRQLKDELDEVFILSTCNRFAIYAVGDDIAPLIRLFASVKTVSKYVRYFPTSENTIHHLLATASGLCSQVKGEHQILAQIKEAYHFALKHESLGIVLDNLIRKAINIGRKVRTESGIDKYCASVVDVGLLKVTEKMPDFRQRKFLIIGTGKIARLALSWMQQEGVHDVWIVSHDLQRAKDIASRYHASVVDIEHTHHFISQADVVLGGTHPEFAFSVDALQSSCIRRSIDLSQSKAKIILDFGMPRNFDDALRNHPGVFLYNLDDLKAIGNAPTEAFGGVDKAWDMILEETYRFLLVLRQLNVSPVLSAYWTRLVDIKDRELEWLLPKLTNVSKHDRALIERYAYKLIRSISKDPLRNIRAMANKGDSLDAMEAVKRLYNLKNLTLNLSEN